MIQSLVRRRALVLAVSVSACLCGTPARALTQQAEPVRINYVNADLRDVIRSLASVLDVNVVLADVPATRITFSTPNPVPASQVGAVLDAILESQGLVLVESGPVANVVRADKKPTGGAIGFGKHLSDPRPIGLITQIVPLEFMRADEGVTLVKQVASPTARIEVVPRSNSVLITDRATNVARYLELLRQLDAKTSGEEGLRTYVYRLKHASADELAGTLGELFGTGTSGGVSQRARVRSLEDRSLSSTLGEFRRRELDALAMRRGAVGPFPMVMRAGADTGLQAGGLAGRTTIVPDPATNSLVIRTAPPNFPVLQETIDQLDVRPAQVLLEVLIAEVSLDRATEFGINWSVFTQQRIGGRPSEVSAGFDASQLADSLLSQAQGFFLRVVRLNNVDVRAVLRALSSTSRVRVLSTPHVLALNNEEARILVGSEVPFSQSTRTGLDVVVDRIVQFRDVGTQLTIVPTINQDGYVTFRILQEVSALTQQTIEAALNAPVITTREAETSAIVKNGQTIVIGGLISDDSNVIEDGIPVLKDLPIIGGLFRNRSSSRGRTELAIFVTPYVVFSDADAEGLLERERGRLDESRDDVDRKLKPSPPKSDVPPATPDKSGVPAAPPPAR